MDSRFGPSEEQVRRYLKELLLHLAARSENPGLELQTILREVIVDLHKDVKESLSERADAARRGFRIVSGATEI
jgi:hypothetical protein